MSEILEPEVLGCFCDEGFSPPLPAMVLRWLSAEFLQPRIWRFPTGLQTVGPAPERFGITILRMAANEYDVYLLWDTARFFWPALAREALANCSLVTFLNAIGTDLNYLLDQPMAANRQAMVKLAA